MITNDDFDLTKNLYIVMHIQRYFIVFHLNKPVSKTLGNEKFK